MENRKDEKWIKAMNSRKVKPRPGSDEKENNKDVVCPYLELRKVLWLKRLRRVKIKTVKGTRQISPVSSV